MKILKKIRKMIRKVKGVDKKVVPLIDKSSQVLMDFGKDIFMRKTSPPSLERLREALFHLEREVSTNTFLEDLEPALIYEIGFRFSSLYSIISKIGQILDNKEFENARLYFRVLLREFEQLRSLILG